MPRISFTVRSTAGASGSYLRYDRGLGDDDSRLRQDGLLTSPLESFDFSFFQGDSVNYGEIALKWGVTVVPAASLNTVPQVAGTVVVYSGVGEPQTIAGGTAIVEDSTTFSYLQTGVPEGRWAYYSLFVHYATDPSVESFYERVASLKVLVPKNYGSTMLMWNRIPLFYRLQDIAQGRREAPPVGIGVSSSDGVIGPLLKYLSIIGFDMDRMRTILDYIMTSNDPQVADSEALDALGWQMAAILKGTDLGTVRLRNLMNDIGYFGRSKGTPASIELWGKALTGGDLTVNPITHTIRLFSQRVNYITVPHDGAGIITSRAASPDEVVVSAANSFGNTSFSGTHPYTPSGTSYGASPGYTFSQEDHGSLLQEDGNLLWQESATNVVTYVMIHVDSPIPVHYLDSVAFSVHSANSKAVQWVRLVTANGTIVGSSDIPLNVAGSRAFEVDVSTGVNG